MLGAYVQQSRGDTFPWGILSVNLLGCFGIGLILSWAELRGTPGEQGRMFLVTGLLGGFTTFSAFGMDTWRLLAMGEWVFAAANVAGNVIGGLAAVMLGVYLARAFA